MNEFIRALLMRDPAFMQGSVCNIEEAAAGDGAGGGGGDARADIVSQMDTTIRDGGGTHEPPDGEAAPAAGGTPPAASAGDAAAAADGDKPNDPEEGSPKEQPKGPDDKLLILDRENYELRVQLRQLQQQQTQIAQLFDLASKDPAAFVRRSTGKDILDLVSGLGDDGQPRPPDPMDKISALEQRIQALTDEIETGKKTSYQQGETGYIGGMLNDGAERWPALSAVRELLPVHEEIYRASLDYNEKTGGSLPYAAVADSLEKKYAPLLEKMMVLQGKKNGSQPTSQSPAAPLQPPPGRKTLTSEMGAEPPREGTQQLTPEQAREALIQELDQELKKLG